MVSHRNLTEVFVLMRNNAIQSRQIFFDQGGDSESVRLMRAGSSRDVENGDGFRGDAQPPPWAHTLEEAHYIISRLRSKIAELQQCQDRQIKRPSLDDTSEQEVIGRLAAEIGKQFNNVHRSCAAIKGYCRQGSKTEQKLVTNVVIALVTTLQDLSLTFRTAQSNYLKTITSREERTNALFDLPNFEELSLDDELLPGLTNNQTDLLFALPTTSTNNGSFLDEQNLDDAFQKQAVSQQQLMLLQEENTKMVSEREEEVNKIIHSIVDLNDIFKDLAHMVHDQGTILDRIDYNIEQTQVQVSEGYKQLKKAESFQKKNRKMHCIFVLAIMIVVMAVLLIIVKS